jgi:hypothetical protein
MITNAILKINPNAKVIIKGSNLDTCTIEWLDGTAEISKTDIQAKIDETKYQRDRQKEYPTWQEQMDMQYKDLLNDTTTWKDAVAKVKTDNPKG